MSALIHLDQASVAYPGFTLHPLTLRLEPGYIAGLLGPNGSGKTTLLRMVAGLTQATSGVVTVGGVPVSPALGGAPGVALISGDDALGDGTTPTMLARIMGRHDATFNRAAFAKLLDRYDIRADTPWGRLNRGRKTYLQLAAAQARSTRLLLLDEATAGLAPDTRQAFRDMVQRYVEDGTRSVLFSTHLTEDVAAIADFVALLHKGRLRTFATTDTVLASYRRVSGPTHAVDALGVPRDALRVTPHGFTGVVEASWCTDHAAACADHGVRSDPATLDEIVVHASGSPQNATDGQADAGWATPTDTAVGKQVSCTPLVRVAGASKRYDGFTLGPATFTVHPGEIVALVGPNGAGKTTLLNLLMGFANATGGVAEVCGTRVGTYAGGARGVGFISGDGDNLPDAANLPLLANHAAALDSTFDPEVFDTTCAAWSVPHDARVVEMSRGQRVAVQIALVCARETRLLILDEPTAGLDPAARARLLEVLQGYVEDGSRSVIFTTHVTEDAERVADRLLVLRDGQVVADANTDAFCGQYRRVAGPDIAAAPAPDELVAVRSTSQGFTALASASWCAGANSEGLVIERASLADIIAGITDSEGARHE